MSAIDNMPVELFWLMMLAIVFTVFCVSEQ